MTATMRIAIEGNIGCGKSTLCSALAASTRWPVVLEPLHEWDPILRRFYDDPRRWGLAMNVNVLASYARWGGDARDIIFERSPMSCRWVFSEQQAADGHMDPIELGIVDALYSGACWTPDAIIYLRCPPHVCFERMTRRARDCEATVGAEYLVRLHERYERMIERASRETAVFCVDAGAPSSAVLDAVVNYLGARTRGDKDAPLVQHGPGDDGDAELAKV